MLRNPKQCNIFLLINLNVMSIPFKDPKESEFNPLEELMSEILELTYELEIQRITLIYAFSKILKRLKSPVSTTQLAAAFGLKIKENDIDSMRFNEAIKFLKDNNFIEEFVSLINDTESGEGFRIQESLIVATNKLRRNPRRNLNENLQSEN